MTFELYQFTECKVLDVRTLCKKDRGPDDRPGAQLLLQATLSAAELSMFDGFLPGMLFRKNENAKQGSLDGVESLELTQIGRHVKRIPWQYEQTGCEVEIDFGLGGKSNIALADCRAHRVTLSPRQAGGALVQWCIDAPDLDDATRGKLTGLKRADVKLKMLAPEPVEDPQGDLDDEAPKRRGRKRQAEGAAA